MRQRTARRLSSLDFDREHDDGDAAGGGGGGDDDNENDNDDNENDDDDDKPSKKARKSTSTASTSTTTTKLTPLEAQYAKIRDKNPGVILAIECGYKYQVRLRRQGRGESATSNSSA